MNVRRHKVLLIAYACEPHVGSEPGTGWNVAMQLARKHDVTVATRANNREVIEAELAQCHGPMPGFLFIDPPSWTLKLKKKRILSTQLFYAFWQLHLARFLRKAGHEIDIIHHLTFNSFEVPPLAFFASKSIKIWGPMGGGQRVPWRLLPAFGGCDMIREGARNIRVIMSKTNPVCKKILRSSTCVLFANDETKALLGDLNGGSAETMIDVGVDVSRFKPSDSRSQNKFPIIVCAGRMEPRKGFSLLLRAFDELADSHPNAILRLIGDGPKRMQLESLAANLRLHENIHFVGRVDHAAMQSEFDQADVFVFPSMRDTSGAVVLEAMAMALPIVTFDHQGAAIMVADDCGIKVRPIHQKQAITDLAKGIATLLSDPKLRINLGRAGRRRVEEHFDWSRKAERILGIYERFTH